MSDRPNAVRQFFEAVKRDPALVAAPWLLMIETDYVWMKPIQAPPAEDAKAPALAFPFGYIQPTHPDAHDVMRKYYPDREGPLSDIPNTGPAPAMMRVDEWLKVCVVMVHVGVCTKLNVLHACHPPHLALPYTMLGSGAVTYTAQPGRVGTKCRRCWGAAWGYLLA